MIKEYLIDSIKAFIRDHAEAKPSDVALKASRLPGIPAAWVAQQIKGRQKVKEKLPLWYANESIVFPPSISLEQCTSEVVARYKHALYSGTNAVDLTGGFGVDSYFLSKSFDRVTYIERNGELAEIAAANFATLGVQRKVATVSADSIDWLTQSTDHFDVAYVDPARRDAKGDKVSDFESCEPNILESWGILSEKSEKIVVKSSPGLDIQRGVEQLSNVSKVYVFSHKNECKELLFICPKGFTGEPAIHCIDFFGDADAFVQFDFTFEQERSIKIDCSEPLTYLYEPNASIMKGGGFKSIATQFELAPLHPRTRLYTSEHRLDDFPGRIFEIEGCYSINRKELKNAFPNDQANVVSRNCSLTPDELKKKLKLKDGGDYYAIGTTLMNDNRALLKCLRIQ